MVNTALYRDISDRRDWIQMEAGKSIRENLPRDVDAEHTKALVNGIEQNLDYVVKESDLIAVRVFPGIATELIVFGAWVLLSSVFVGTALGINAYQNQEKRIKELEELNKLKSSTSDDTVNIPWLKGASNTMATGKTQPYVIGEHLFTPYILNSGNSGKGYNILAGDSNDIIYYVAVLEGGFNSQILKKIYCDTSTLKTFEAEEMLSPQEGIFDFDEDSLFADSTSLVEISQDGQGFTQPEFNKKIVQNTVSDQLYKADDTNYEDLIYTLPDHAMDASVCILFNGLIAYDSNGDGITRSVQVNPYWRAKKNGEWSDWTAFSFKDASVQAPRTYGARIKLTAKKPCSWAMKKQTQKRAAGDTWISAPSGRYTDWTPPTLTVDYIKGLINDGEDEYYSAEYVDGPYYTENNGTAVETESFNFTGSTMRSNTDSRRSVATRVETVGYKINQDCYNYYDDCIVLLEYKDEDYTNNFSGCTRDQLYFDAHVDFTPEQVLDAEEVQVKLVCPTDKYTAASVYDDCYVQWIQSQIYDRHRSTSDSFCAESIIGEKEAKLSTLIGIKIKSTTSNESKLTKINVETQGIARTWNGTEWSTGKTATRNPAAWLLEVLTSNTHFPSKYDDSELDLESFGELYEWCENQTDASGNTFSLHCDMVLTSGETKENVIQKILATCYSTLYRNMYGKIAVATDKAQENAIALLNPQNLISFKWKKNNTRRVDGMNITYTAHDEWEEDTYRVGRNGIEFPDSQDSNYTLRDTTLTGIEDFDAVVKYGRYLMACEELRPHTISATIGMEGTFFTPYSKVLVQHPSLSVGLGHATIKALILDENQNITGLELYQNVVLDGESSYSIVVQCTSASSSDYAVPVAYDIENTEGTANEITFITPIDASESVKPLAGDILSWGYEQSTVTNEYIITGVESAGQGKFTLTLTDYNESIYDAGEIPDYTPNLTHRLTPVADEVPDNSMMFREYAKKSDLKSIYTCELIMSAVGSAVTGNVYKDGIKTQESLYFADFYGTGTESAVAHTGTTGVTSAGTLSIPAVSDANKHLVRIYSNQDRTDLLCTGYVSYGLNGETPRVYYLEESPNAVKRLNTGLLAQGSITFSSKYREGSGTPQSYYGRFKIEYSTDCINWISAYTSSTNEAQVTYTIPTGVKVQAIRGTLYMQGGTSIQLDQDVVPVIEDGISVTSIETLYSIGTTAGSSTTPTTTVQTTTTSKPVQYSCVKITFSDGSTVTTSPVPIGTQGLPGAVGGYYSGSTLYLTL